MVLWELEWKADAGGSSRELGDPFPFTKDPLWNVHECFFLSRHRLRLEAFWQVLKELAVVIILGKGKVLQATLGRDPVGWTTGHSR